MRLSILFFSFIFGFQAFAVNVTCSSEAKDFFVTIDDEKLDGSLNYDSVCINLQCQSFDSGYDCQGFFNNNAYYVSYNGALGGFVNRTNGRNYDTLGYFTCAFSD